jgi:hypothetical protein
MHLNYKFDLTRIGHPEYEEYQNEHIQQRIQNQHRIEA